MSDAKLLPALTFRAFQRTAEEITERALCSCYCVRPERNVFS
jgi:hypothetical protein